MFERELSELKEKINSCHNVEHNSNERFENIEKSINELKRNPNEVSPFIILIVIVLILLSKLICYFKYRNHLLYPKELNQPS